MVVRLDAAADVESEPLSVIFQICSLIELRSVVG